MLDTPIQQPVVTDKKPVVSYARSGVDFTGKGAIAGAVVGFAYGVVKSKSKIFWTLIGASVGMLVETAIKSFTK